MKRTLVIRKKSIELWTLDTTIAVKQATPSRGIAHMTPELFAGVAPPESPDATALLQLGWRFARMDTGLKTAARSGASAPGTEAVRELSVTPSGRLLASGDVLVVKLKANFEDSEAIQRILDDKLSVVRRMPFPNTYEVRTTNVESALDAAMRLSELTPYDFAEPAFDEVIGGRWQPQDPDFGRQWQWLNDGGGGGTPNADVRILQAWDATRGRRADGTPIRVAVVDNGFDVTHPDLAEAIVHGGHFDNDGTGSTTFVPYRRDDSFPDRDHGTFCAGMAVARANNQSGGCGAAPECAFIPVACLRDQVGSQATLARALVYAALPTIEEPSRSNSEGADVIACSLGPNGPDWELHSVLDLAIRRVAREGRGGLGTPIFWAVSNGPFEISRDEVVSHPDIIKVGRSNRLDLRDGSAFGPALDFLAPGAAVFSTCSGGGHGAKTGSSFAAPLAAGVGALVLAANPALTAQALRQRMRSACDKVGPLSYVNGRNDEYGFGRINAARSI